MVLGTVQSLILLIWTIVGQGSTVLAVHVAADGDCQAFFSPTYTERNN